ncbi:hypothetical protein TIFTF001_019908 [Ficus carica]|uniref:Uncharacterized protein n=1 Tax=Ficus carica TaxID=3494 RepID=A0AA88ADU9_FICCA|nr:hypothetical protein TIFTF001_019908 [Ficus carica]
MVPKKRELEMGVGTRIENMTDSQGRGQDSDLNAYPLPMRSLNYCTCAYFFLLYPEDSFHWHCDYRYIANRKSIPKLERWERR